MKTKIERVHKNAKNVYVCTRMVGRVLTKCWPVCRLVAHKRCHSWSESPVGVWCPTARPGASGPPGRWIWAIPSEPGLWCWSPTLTASNTWTSDSSRPSFRRFFFRSPTWFLCRDQAGYMFKNVPYTVPHSPCHTQPNTVNNKSPLPQMYQKYLRKIVDVILWIIWNLSLRNEWSYFIKSNILANSPFCLPIFKKFIKP